MDNIVNEAFYLQEGQQKRWCKPFCTKGEETFNAISHLAGCGLSIFFCVAASGVASASPTWNKYLAIGVYSVALFFLYLMSGLYHAQPAGQAKGVLRILDHCTIFLLIAGCYTPFCLITLWDEPIGKVILAVEWGMAILGIIMNAVNMEAKFVKIFSQICYLVMGWMILFGARTLASQVSLACFLWLLAGGICYTVGILFYALGKKKSWMHCVWHVFVLAGSALQFVSILYIL